MSGLDRRPLRALVALTVLAAALRFSTLGVQSFWSDEAVTAKLLDQSLGRMLDAIPSSESTPPLYYVLAWLWTRVFGVTEVGVRSLSALFGTLLVPVAFTLGARLASVRAGLAAAALVAVNPLLWWYSQEGRSYALLVLLTAAAAAAFLRPGRRSLAAWAVLSALALATHYFAVFLVGPQAAWIAWQALPGRRRGANRKAALAAVGGVLLAAGALLPLAIRQASNNGAKFIESSGSLAFRIGQVPKQFLVGFDAPLEIAATAVAALTALVLIVLAVARTDRRERRGAALAGGLAVVALVLPAIGALAGADYLLARNLLPALVPALAVLGVGATAAGARAAGPLAAALLCAISIATIIGVATTKRFQRDDWRDAAHALGAATRDRVIALTPSEGADAIEWYLPGARPIGPANVAVGELDIVGLARRAPGHELDPPRGPVPVPAGFSMFQKSDGATFRVVRFSAEPPVGVTYFSAAANRLSPAPVNVLVQQKGAQTR